MKKGFLLVVILSISMIAGTVVAYDGTGKTDSTGTLPEVQCNDGKDNDGDGQVDGADLGCSNPLWDDKSENLSFDVDATFAFMNGNGASAIKNSPTRTLPSFGRGQEEADNGEQMKRFDDDVTVTNFYEVFINNSLGSYGGGSLIGGDGADESVEFDYSKENYTKKSIGSGDTKQYYLIDKPLSSGANANNNPNSTCGNAEKDEGFSSWEDKEYNFKCPQDYGLPDDKGTTQSKSNATTITDVLSANSGTTKDIVASACGSECSGLLSSERVNFSHDLAASEFNGGKDYEVDGKTVSVGPSSISFPNVKSKFSNLDSNNDYLLGAKVLDSPDFYLESSKSNRVMAKYLKRKTYETIGPSDGVTAWYVTEKSGTKYSSSGSDYTSCTPNEDKCEVKESNVCVDVEDKSPKDNYQKPSNQETLEITGYTFNGYYTEGNDPGITEKITGDQQGDKLTVTYYSDEPTLGSFTPEKCTDRADTYYCVDKDDADNTFDCTISDEKTIYDSKSRTYNPDKGSYNIKFKQEQLEFAEEPVFSLNPERNPQPQVEPKEALFKDDTFWGKTFSGTSSLIQQLGDKGEGYFSYEVEPDNKGQGNDPAMTLSTFRITTGSPEDTEQTHFMSQRNGTLTFDADGKLGKGDSFIALKKNENGYYDLADSTSDFADKEVGSGGFSSYVGLEDLKKSNSGSGPSRVFKSGFKCGDARCVTSVDFSLKNLANWKEGSNMQLNPGSTLYGLQVESYKGSRSVNDSLGVCEFYKQITGDDALVCRYPTVDNVEETCGNNADDDGDGLIDEGCGRPPAPQPCGTEVGETWVAMEGPEVNVSVASDYRGLSMGCVKQSNGCFVNGRAVAEGTIMDINSDRLTRSMEFNGSSPDKEICLNIPGKGDDVSWDNGGGGDRGGEWYDLDDETINNRASSLAQKYGVASSSSNNMTYYVRENNNPFHPLYNPGGQNTSLAIEDDCGNPRFGTTLWCDDSDSSKKLVYSFFGREAQWD